MEVFLVFIFIVGYVEGLWVLARSEDKHIETFPPNVLSEHLMHMLACEETKCKRFEFDDWEWMQTCLSGDDPCGNALWKNYALSKNISICVKFWTKSTHFENFFQSALRVYIYVSFDVLF